MHENPNLTGAPGQYFQLVENGLAFLRVGSIDIEKISFPAGIFNLVLYLLNMRQGGLAIEMHSGNVHAALAQCQCNGFTETAGSTQNKRPFTFHGIRHGWLLNTSNSKNTRGSFFATFTILGK